jgi:hypothetical protein
MEVARDLLELQELISELGLTDDKRDSLRYKVSIPGNYYVEEEGQLESLYTCRLVDVSTRGACIEIDEVTVQLGDTVHLQFSVGSNITEAVGEVVYIDGKCDGYRVGLQSTIERDNIVNQLLSKSWISS